MQFLGCLRDRLSDLKQGEKLLVKMPMRWSDAFDPSEAEDTHKHIVSVEDVEKHVTHWRVDKRHDDTLANDRVKAIDDFIAVTNRKWEKEARNKRITVLNSDGGTSEETFDTLAKPDISVEIIERALKSPEAIARRKQKKIDRFYEEREKSVELTEVDFRPQGG